jgi:hypothetical protein
MVPKKLTQDKKTTGKTFALTSKNESQNNRMYIKMSSSDETWIFFSIRSGNEEIINALEDTHFTENEKSKNGQVESEGNDDYFLGHQSS